VRPRLYGAVAPTPHADRTSSTLNRIFMTKPSPHHGRAFPDSLGLGNGLSLRSPLMLYAAEELFVFPVPSPSGIFQRNVSFAPEPFQRKGVPFLCLRCAGYAFLRPEASGTNPLFVSPRPTSVRKTDKDDLPAGIPSTLSLYWGRGYSRHDRFGVFGFGGPLRANVTVVASLDVQSGFLLLHHPERFVTYPRISARCRLTSPERSVTFSQLRTPRVV